MQGLWTERRHSGGRNAARTIAGGRLWARACDRAVRIVTSIAFVLAPVATHAQQLPTGGAVAAGSATISHPSANTLNINQSTNTAIVNWQSFSVGQGGTVNFNQPGASSATLNRVTGDVPSTIAGAINAPGAVLLVNPNGIAITKSGVINTGSFVGSTLDIKNEDFLAGRYKFTGNGGSAAVSNAGRINVSDGGFAALLGGQVSNSGMISARLGKVGLGAGELITLDLSGDGFLSVAVPSSQLGNLVDPNGALITNSGQIQAKGGQVYLSAATAANILRNAVNVPGSIQANSVGTHHGKIVIGGGAGGRVSVSGKLAANGGRTGNGGTVNVSGATVAVSGKISAGGNKGGSVTLAANQSADIWGSVSARGTTDAGGTIVVTAKDIKLASEAVLDAGGASGGTVLVGGDYQGGANAANNFVTYPILNAFATTVAAGAQIKADGSNGAGGKIVVWSDDHTTFAGAISAQGSGSGQGGFAEISGHRLLDFTGTANLLAANGAAGTLLLDPRNVTISSGANSGGSIASGTYTPSADDSILNVTTLQTALLSGNVIVTTGSTGSQSGDITVASPVTWTSHTLTLDAYHSINVNATMSASGSAGLALKTNDGGSGGSLNFNGGNVTFASTSQSLSINGTAYTLLNSMTGVQNINNGLSGNYALAKSLDATGVSSWVPIGTDGAGNIQNSSKGFTGNFNGLGNTISNLTINLPSVPNVGLFGAASGASISSLALANVNVTGGDHTGALLGFDGAGISVNGVSASGSVSGQYQTGGLIGWFDAGSTLTRGSAAVTVTSPVNDVGGLVGYADGNVFQSYATGTVTGQYNVGGLIGRAAADVGSPSVQQSFATGAVTGLASVGGLIGGTTGVNQVTVQQSYATGSTRATSLYSVGIGGLIGSNSTTLTVSESYATGWINTPNSYGGGLIGYYGSTTPAVTSSYYDADPTGWIVGGVSTATLQAALPSGWSSSAWGIVAGKSYPFFLWQYPAAGGAPQVISGNALNSSGSSSTPGVTVSALVNGASVGSAMTGINGYYNILVAPNTIAANSQVAAYTTGSPGGFTYQQNTPAGSLTGLNINAAYLTEISQASTLSAVSAGLATAIGSTGVSTGYGNRSIVAQGASFTIDQAITQSGLLRLSAAGNVTQAAGASLAVSSLQMISAAANYALLDTGNKVTNLRTTNLGSGSLSLYDSVDLTVGNVTANGGVSIQTAGTLLVANTIASSATGNAIVLAAGNKFTNNLGASVLSAPNGRWLVYSSDPTSDTFNNLDSGNTAVWNGTYAANAPATIASGNRYVFAYQPTVTLTSSNASKSYGATPDLSANFTVSGLNAGIAHAYLADTAATAYSGAPTLTSAGSAASASVAGGPYLIDISQGSVTGSNGYAVSFVDAGMLTVNKANLTITANDVGKIYGTALSFNGSEFTTQGLVSGDTVSSVTLASAGAASSANIGKYAIAASNASGSGLSNYNVSYVGGTLNVTPAMLLVVTANNASKTYGDTLTFNGSEFTTQGLQSGDTVTSVSLASAGAAATAAAGQYAITASNAVGSGLSNYSISYAPGTLTVAKANLTITANDAGKTFDGLAYSGGNGVTYAGFVNGETSAVLGGTLAYGGAAQGAKNAGSYGLTASGLTSSNYTISYSAGALSIGKAALTVAANDAGKTYDGLAFSGGNGVSYTGFVNGETSAVLSGALAYGGTAQAAKNAGRYSLTASGLTSNNYAISYTGGALTISKAALTVTANDAGKTYDGLAFSGGNGISYAGFVNGETSAVLGGTLAYGGPAQGAKNAGGYTLTASGLTSSNYAISYTAGTLTVAKANLAVTANDASKTYDGLAFSGGNGVNYAGFVNGETASVLGGTLAYMGTAQGAKNAGSYTLTASGVTATNYNITYVGGTLTIDPAPLTVTATNFTKAYNGQAFNGYASASASGFVNGEDAGVLNGQLVAGGTAQGAVNAGTYAISLSGLTSSNYNITYVPGTLTIQKANLFVSANNLLKSYDGQAFSGGNGVTYTGFATGETSAVLGGTLTYGGTAQGAVNAGSYTLTASGLTSSNYNINYSAGALKINQALLTVTANNASKTYDGQAFSGGNGVTYSGLVNGETSAVLGGMLTYGGTAQGAVNAGNYGLTASGLTSSNYSIGYLSGTLTVNKANLAVTANDAGKTYDGLAFSGGNGVSYSGFVNGETSSVLGGTLAYGGTAQGAKNAGSYSLTASGLTSTNYAISYTAGALNVGKAALTVTANDASKTYDGQAFSGGNGVSYAGLVNGETASVLGGTLSYGGTAQGAVNSGSYSLTASGLTSSNYAISYVGGALNVGKAALTVTANDASKTYDGQAFSGGNGVNYAGFVNGESASVLGGSLAYGGSAQGATNAGSYGLTASGLTASNYAISYTAGALTLAKANLAVTANDAGKTYDGLAFSGGNGVSYSGFVNGETAAVLGGTLSYGGTAQGAKNAGSYGLTASGLTSSNYAISYAGGALNIAKAALTVTANDAGKTYDGQAFSGGNGVSYAGLVNGETASVLGGTLAYGGSAQGAKNAGSYSLTASGLTSSNYAISYVDGALNIGKAALTVTANDAGKTYDGQAFSGGNGVSYTGLVNGETGSVLGGTLSYGGTAQGAKNAGSYSLTASGLTSSNYSISYAGGALNVGKTALTVTANDATKTYDGQAFSGGNGVSYAGFVNGETSAVLGGTLVYGGTAQGAKDAGSYGLTASGLTASNYTIGYVGGALNVGKAALTVTANDAAKTYDGQAFSGGNGVSYAGFVNGETASVLGGTLSYGGTAQGAKNAGSYGLTASGLTSSNYSISYAGGALNIGKAALTVTANDAGKTYDGQAFSGGNGVSYAGFVNGETSSVLGGTLSYGGTAQGAKNAGSYTLTASGLTASNYSIGYVGGSLNVGKAALTVTANDASKTYDGLAFSGGNGVSYAGLVNGETSSVLGGTLAYGGTAQGAKNANSYSLTASGLTASNYAISYVGGALTVDKATLTVAALDRSKTYGGTLTFGSVLNTDFSVSGLKGSDAVNGVTLASAGAAATANVGQYGIAASNATGSGLSNYNVNYVGGTLNVTTAQLLLVTANNATKIYGSTLTFNGSEFIAQGLQNGDTVTSVVLASAGAAATSGAGQYAITASNAAGSGLGNYAITYAPGTLTVSKANLTVTANDAGKTYDGLGYSGGNGVSYSGFVNGETSSVLGGTLAYGGTAQGAKNAGSYGLTASGLTSSNYSISYAGGALNIGKAALTVTANDASKTYDGLAFSGGNGVSYTGLVNGETSSVLGGTLAYGGTAQGAKNAGSYTLTASGLTSSNYTIGYVGGALNIGKAALTVTANDAGKTYDGQAFSGGNGVSYAGFVNGETSSVLGGTLAYGGTAQGAKNAGSYSLTASGLTASNYSIGYVGGSLNIGKAALTVTANDASKTYDGLAFSGGNGVSYAGFVNGETSSVLGGTLSYGGTAQGAKNAGSYTLTASGVTSSNYTIGYVGGALNVGKATLTVTANDASKTYDGLAFSGGNGVSYAGFVNGETASVLGGTLSYGGTAQGAKNAGSYGLTASGLTSSNYTISYAGGALNIGKAALTATVNDASKTYDGLAFSGGNGVSYAGLVNGETASVLGGTLSYGGTAQGAKNAGSYTLTASGLTSSNYTIGYAGGALNIGKAALTVTANDASKTYDGQAFSGGNGVSYAGFVNGENASVLGGKLAYGGSAQGAINAGGYSLTASGLTASNYNVSYVGGALNVAKAALTVTANDASKTYDGQAFSAGNGVSYAGLVNGETASVLGGTLTYGGTAQGAKNAGNYSLTASGLTASNYSISYVGGALNVAKAALTVTANDASKTYDGQAFSGGNGVSYTGFVKGETASVLGGTLSYGGTAQGAANVGTYSIAPVGLTSGNYAIAFVNGTLTVNAATVTKGTSEDASSYFASRYTAPGSSASAAPTSINFQAANPAPIQASFTPAIRTAAAPPAATPTNVSTAGIVERYSRPFATNGGFVFAPISQYDAGQYSQSALPGYQDRDSMSAVFTIIARAVLPDQAPDFLIDGFWKAGASRDWRDAAPALADRVTFSDGRDQAVMPGETSAFALKSGGLDLAALLAKGPVIVGGSIPDRDGTHWMLATRLTDDGKGIVADDPITGQQVVLSYDPDTKTVGGVIEIYDPRSKAWVAVTVDAAQAIMSDAGLKAVDPSGLGQFAPTSYFVVAIKQD